MLFISFLELFGALVIEYVEFGCEAVVLKFAMKLGPCIGKLAGLARLKRLGEDMALLS